MAVYASQANARGPFMNHPPPGMQAKAVPAGAFLPGTKVQVGTHRVVIERYLSEGGFATVYVVILSSPVEGNDRAVLKRVVVPDKEHLALMRNEVETMKRLRGQKHIVKYMDSHASQLKGTGFEVFLLMEFCSGGGLIDFMNTRLQNRLTEPEIVKIFTDVAYGVAGMHYLDPPLMHRDIKIENVLITMNRSSRMFKLCDFGSAAPARPAATSAAEGRIIEEDILRNTTLQYRSPEMIDVYRKQPIDEKSDIWALGVFLYKLCYYTTPFEEVGQTAILNARFKYPGHPRFSDPLKLMIASMLREQPSQRPNIYQILQKACQMDKREFRLKDIYHRRAQSETRGDQDLPPHPSTTQGKAGATLSPPPAQEDSGLTVPDITPMRRGRPDRPSSVHAAKPSPSPLRVIDGQGPDAFASLDSGRITSPDDFSSRFPALDQFSLMTDPRKNYQFDKAKEPPESAKKALNQRVTEALADDAFAKPNIGVTSPVGSNVPSLPTSQSVPDDLPNIDAQEAAMQRPVVPKPKAPITSPSAKPDRFSSKGLHQSSSSGNLARQTEYPQKPPKPQSIAGAGKPTSRLANLLQEDSERAQGGTAAQPSQSRASLEGGRPLQLIAESGINRSQSLNVKNRPVSLQVSPKPAHIKEVLTTITSVNSDVDADSTKESESAAAADLSFLQAREEEEKKHYHHHHHHHHHHIPHHPTHVAHSQHSHHVRSGSESHSNRRVSLPHIPVAGTKNIITGKFGDAFKVFEGAEPPRPNEKKGSHTTDQVYVVKPNATSEVAEVSGGIQSPEDIGLLSPVSKRELEKRQSEEEEKRVAAAAAEYKERAGGRGTSPARGGAGRAAAIQSKVQALLQQDNSRAPPPKTAAGYGRYTDVHNPPPAEDADKNIPARASTNVAKPIPVPNPGVVPHAMSAPPSATTIPAPTMVGVPLSPTSSRPQAPPKPSNLRNPAITSPPVQISQPAPTDMINMIKNPISPGPGWEADFNKKYPSLPGFEATAVPNAAAQLPQAVSPLAEAQPTNKVKEI